MEITTTTNVTFHFSFTAEEIKTRIQDPAIITRELRAALHGQGISTTVDAPASTAKPTAARKQKQFTCSVCSNKFPNRSLLMAHKRDAHNIRVQKVVSLSKTNGHLQAEPVEA